MRTIGIIVMLIAFVSCKEKPGYEAKNENGGDEVYSVKGEDAAMNQAIRTAVSTYPDFINDLKRGDSTQTDFAVKVMFVYDVEKDSHEHMWLNDLNFKDNKLYGTLDSDPVSVSRVKAGDIIEVKKDSVSDWMYVQNGKLKGGYTIKALYNKMTEAEKQEFKKQVPFELE